MFVQGFHVAVAKGAVLLSCPGDHVFIDVAPGLGEAFSIEAKDLNTGFPFWSIGKYDPGIRVKLDMGRWIVGGGILGAMVLHRQ